MARSVVVFRSAERERCIEMQAALGAVGLASALLHTRGRWMLAVDEQDRAAAVDELEAYVRESAHAAVDEPAPLRALSGGGLGVFGYVVVLLTVAGLAAERWLGADWLAAGRMQAGLVADGEWWRVFTALTLHLDAAHLLANVVFGSVLGVLASQALGAGVAWLGIVVAGGMGNALNVLIQNPRHSAVGASTAVFAALGILVAHALVHRQRTSERPARRWSPLIGGVVLLAFVGMGGVRTDVMAHVTGLFCGTVVGFVGSRLSIGLLERRSVQRGATVCTLVILVLSWAIALAPLLCSSSSRLALVPFGRDSTGFLRTSEEPTRVCPASDLSIAGPLSAPPTGKLPSWNSRASL